MELTHQIIEEQHYVERYVRHELSEDEETDFEKHYFNCPSCAQKMLLMQEIVCGIRRYADQKEISKEQIVRVGIYVTLATIFSRYGRRLIWAGTFVIILGVFVAPYTILMESKQGHVTQIIQPDSGPSRTEQPGNNLFQRALGAFAQEDDTKAIALLLDYLKQDSSSFWPNYLLGLSHLRDSRPDIWNLYRTKRQSVIEAIHYLNEALSTNEGKTNDEYRAFCYIHLGKAHILLEDFQQAKNVLLQSQQIKFLPPKLESEINKLEQALDQHVKTKKP